MGGYLFIYFLNLNAAHLTVQETPDSLQHYKNKNIKTFKTFKLTGIYCYIAQPSIDSQQKQSDKAHSLSWYMFINI